MKRLIFCITILFMILSSSKGQEIREIKPIDLPGYVEHDTLILKNVWVQTLKSEAEQRKKIINLEHRLNKITEILRKKKKINDNTAELIAEVELLKAQNDSLLNRIDLELEREHSNLKLRIELLNNYTIKLEKQIKDLRLIKRRLTKFCIISTSIAVAKAVVMIAILI